MEQRTGAELEAEEPADPTPSEAGEWVEIYTKLIDFTNEMLERTREELARHRGPGRRHLETTNVRIMKEELDVFERRRSVLVQRMLGSQPGR